MRLLPLFLALGIAAPAWAGSGETAGDPFVRQAQEWLGKMNRAKSVPSRSLATRSREFKGSIEELDRALSHLRRDSLPFWSLLDHRNALILGAAETCFPIPEGRTVPLLLPHEALNLLERNGWEEETTAVFLGLQKAEATLFGRSPDEYNPCDKPFRHEYDLTGASQREADRIRSAWRERIGGLMSSIRELRATQANTFLVLANRYNRLVFELSKGKTGVTERDRAWLLEPPIDTDASYIRD